jgi:hypothetical protein
MTTRNPSVNPRSDPAAPPMALMQEYNVVGTFRDRTDAQSALEQLRARGIGVGEAALLGETQDLQPTRYGLTEEDRKVAGGVMRTVTLYAIAGAVLLAIVGVILVLIGPFRDAIGFHMSLGLVLDGIIIGALIGLIIGGIIGYIAGLDRGTSGHDSYGDQFDNSPTSVGLKAATPEAVQRARTMLTELGATDVATVTPMQRGDG